MRLFPANSGRSTVRNRLSKWLGTLVRLLLIFIGASSLFVCVRSYAQTYQLNWVYPTRHGNRLGEFSGCVSIDRGRCVCDWTATESDVPQTELDDYVMGLKEPENYFWVAVFPTEGQPTLEGEDWYGFYWHSSNIASGHATTGEASGMTRSGIWELPLWLIAAASLLNPCIFVSRILRSQRNPEQLKCPDCGYDLRATPNRCPECGAASKAADPGSRSTWLAASDDGPSRSAGDK